MVVSTDSRDEAHKLALTRGLTFPVLSDPTAAVIRRYGVLHPKGGEDGQDVARPAEFLVDRDRAIRWTNFTEDIRVRARANQLMAVIDRLRL